MSTSDARDADPLIGTIFADRYEILSRLGKGGMAVVYRAVDRNLGREVAIKVLRTDVANDPVAAKRLEREGRAAATLQHPHIITVYDRGIRDGAYFVVMEILVGKEMSTIMETEGAISVERALDMGEQIASALAVAHQGGIIHRDIKPENLFLIETGGGGDFIKMLDFSIAKLPTHMVTAALTRAGSVFGTPHYMAPEQVEGKAAVPQTDVYALGAVLFELIMGEPPFDGSSVIDILLKHVKQPPPPLGRPGMRLPTGLRELVAQMLAKKPDERPASAAVVRDKLSKMLAEARGDGGERDAPSGPPPMPPPKMAPPISVPPLMAPMAPSAPTAPLAPTASAPPSPFAPPSDGGDERTIVGVGMAAQVRAAVARQQAPALKPVPTPGSAVPPPPARRAPSPLAGAPASGVEAPNAVPRPQPVPRPVPRPAQGAPAPIMNDMPTLRAPTLGARASSAANPRPVTGAVPRPNTGAVPRPSEPPPASRPPQSTYQASNDEELDLFPTQPEMKPEPGSVVRRPQASRETVSPQLASSPRKTWLWIAIPAGIVGLLAMGAAIWLVLQRS